MNTDPLYKKDAPKNDTPNRSFLGQRLVPVEVRSPSSKQLQAVEILPYHDVDKYVQVSPGYLVVMSTINTSSALCGRQL